MRTLRTAASLPQTVNLSRSQLKLAAVLCIFLIAASILAVIGILKNSRYLLLPLMGLQTFFFVSLKITITDYLIRYMNGKQLYLGLVCSLTFLILTALLIDCLWVLYCTFVRIPSSQHPEE